MAKLNGVKDPKFVSWGNVHRFRCTTNTRICGSGFDVYKKNFGIDLLIAYPVTGDWMK